MSDRSSIASDADDDTAQEDGPGGVARARGRAIKLARAGATDAEIATVLRSEFCAPAPDPVRVSVLVRSLEGWVNRGLLDDARVAGELAVRQALHDMASGGESRDRTTAAIFLAKRLELIEGLGPEVERQRKRLMGMSARELAREVRRLCEALEIEPWPSA